MHVTVIVDIFSLLTAAAGWYYLLYSPAARRLERIEASRVNRTRIILRRIGGLVMMLLGILFFAGFQEWVAQRAEAFVVVWIGVLVLLLTIVVLALIDLRLTWKLRQERWRGRQ